MGYEEPTEHSKLVPRKRKRYNHDGDSHAPDDSFVQSTSKKSKVKVKEEETSGTEKSPTKRKGKQPKKAAEEKRKKQFRKTAPQSYLQAKERALTQRFAVMKRERSESELKETVQIAGTTGNVYTILIQDVPDCDCPHSRKGNQCKHIIYTMLRVLKAPEHIAYQRALLTTELQDLFKNAPPIPDAEADSNADGNRKPIEGDCPICYEEFDAVGANEAIVYCRASCGNNVHEACIDQWAKASAGKLTCPYCRSNWFDTDLFGSKVDLKTATVNEEGYVNVAPQLGLSGERDYSTYHPFWVRQQLGNRRYYTEYGDFD